MPGDKQINIRVTQEQLTEIQNRAREARMSVTLFLTRLGLGEMDRFTAPPMVAPAPPATPTPKAVLTVKEPAPIERMYVTEDGDEIELFDGMMRSDPRDEELSQRYNWARDTWEPWG